VELGGYVGILHGRELVAMAGQRMRPEGFCEISAVCTDESARRRGYASVVTAAVARGIQERGETPFLNVRTDNAAAIPVYERLGFVLRAVTAFAVLRVPGA
jgi:ribosomal protein S18 acetylase RimI-like enzyme